MVVRDDLLIKICHQIIPYPRESAIAAFVLFKLFCTFLRLLTAARTNRTLTQCRFLKVDNLPKRKDDKTVDRSLQAKLIQPLNYRRMLFTPRSSL